MNFEWKQIAERGQSAIGYIDVYELVYKQKAIAIIYYLPQHSDVQQRVVLTIILEGEKRSWTDGTLASILEDVENRIKNIWFAKFNTFNSLEYMDTQIFRVKSIVDFDYLNHGDQAFIDEK